MICDFDLNRFLMILI